MLRHRLTDEQWSVIEDLFPAPALTGRPVIGERSSMTSCGFCEQDRLGGTCPQHLGHGRQYGVYSMSGMPMETLDLILDRLRADAADADEIDDELWCVDGTIVRAVRWAAGGEEKGIPRNRKTTRSVAAAAVLAAKSTFFVTVTVGPCTTM